MSDKMVGKVTDNKLWFAGIYYIPVALLYVINMFMPMVRPGVIATVLMIGVFIELIIRKDIKMSAFIDRLVLVYFAYNALSVIWLLRSGMPFGVYIQEAVVSLLPVIFYYVGKTCIKNETFPRNYIIAILIIGILGIILQLAMPQFYIDYSYSMSYVSKADAATCRVRMDSVVGSTVLGFLSVAAMLFSIPFVMDKKTRLFGVISMFINFITAFMSNQRSAMVVAILAIAYFNYLLFFVYKTADRKYFLIEIGLLAVAFIGLFIFKLGAIKEIYYRLVSLPSAVGERSEQWIAAVNNMYSTWLGNGLGANGHRAIGIEDAHVIADGGIVKLYCEQGIFGFSMFIYIIILTFKKGIKDLKALGAEVGIIAVALLQSIGSNILAFQLAAPVFWYSIGRIHSDTLEDNGEAGS